MAKETKSTTVSLSGQFTKDNVPALLEKVCEQIKALKGDKEKNTRITGGLAMFGKISDITDVDVLRAAYAYITAKVAAVSSHDAIFKSAAPIVKLNTYKEGGATVEQWQEEIIIQYKEIAYKEQLTKLERTKTTLEAHLSEDLKLAAALKNIAEDLDLGA